MPVVLTHNTFHANFLKNIKPTFKKDYKISFSKAHNVYLYILYLRQSKF